MKTCSTCGHSEPQAVFLWKKSRGKLVQRSQCQACVRIELSNYYAKNASYFEAYRKSPEARTRVKACTLRVRHERYARIEQIKSNPCTDCGGTFPSYVMDFDHRDPSQKVRDVSSLVKRSVSWDSVLEEISKCDLVCVRCHRKRTYKGDCSYRTRTYNRNRSVVDEIKSENPCLDCYGFYDPCQMDFDHVFGQKSKTISQLMGCSEEVLLKELLKCQLVCANCHRIRTQAHVKRSSAPIPVRTRSISVKIG